MTDEEKPKKKQKPKKGRVIRLTPDLVRLVDSSRKRGETIPETLRRLFGEVRYVLPSDLHETIEDARGAAIIRAVRAKTKKAEEPLVVRSGR